MIGPDVDLLEAISIELNDLGIKAKSSQYPNGKPRVRFGNFWVTYGNGNWLEIISTGSLGFRRIFYTSPTHDPMKQIAKFMKCNKPKFPPKSYAIAIEKILGG